MSDLNFIQKEEEEEKEKSRRELAHEFMNQVATLNPTEQQRRIRHYLHQWFYEEIENIKTTTGISIPFTVSITTTILDHEKDPKKTPDIVIISGLVPEIYVSESFVFVVFFESKLGLLKRVARQCFDKLRLVRKSLKKPVPYSDVLLWRRESEKWLKGNGTPDKYLRYINPRHFRYDITYTITAYDDISGTATSVTGTSLIGTKELATARLQQLVASDQVACEMHEMQAAKEIAKQNPQTPLEIHIDVDTKKEEINTQMIYEKEDSGNVNE